MNSDAGDEYLRSVYHDRLNEEWKAFSDLDPEMRRKVQAWLDSLPEIAWSPLASPADQFFIVEGYPMPMSVFEDIARKIP